MPIAAGTTKHESGADLAAATGLIAGTENWIPAFAGMTVWRWYCGYFQGNDSDGPVFSSMEVWVDSCCGVRESLNLTRDGKDLKLFRKQGIFFPDIT